MSTFVFKNYAFDDNVASFEYAFSDGRSFTERVTFATEQEYDATLLDKALFLAFTLIGTSYYKTFPTPDVQFENHKIDVWQADFLSNVYQEGLSQFAFENSLTRQSLAQFKPTSTELPKPSSYDGQGIIALQSGGKDSLLLATLLTGKHHSFTPWYVSSSDDHPAILDDLGQPLYVAKRAIDRQKLNMAQANGGLNGHVPITYIVQSLALIQAILLGKNTVLTAIGHEGEEAHDWIGDLAVNHQWSKTWSAEQSFADYVQRYISPDIRVGSSLRQFSELKIAELFVEVAWKKYGYSFSSCNVANYQQGNNNRQLKWCGHCPKCANSYLLFAPFVPATELQSIFHGDLFMKPELTEIFKGLLGVAGVMKPFECVGEIDELRYAYHQAQKEPGFTSVSFEVPNTVFNKNRLYNSQLWVRQFSV